MTRPIVSSRASLAFSALGHLYAHLFEPIFFVVALVLPTELGMSYEQVLTLIIAAKLLYGLLAPLAGWLGDRWSTVGMMAVYFLGLGVSAIAVGLTGSAWALAVALAATGAFGAIYHPVGSAWLLRNAVDRGKAIGINGVFGGVGPAVAALIAGWAIEGMGWRFAFVGPGILILVTGLVFLWALARGHVVELKGDRAPPPPPVSRGDSVRVGLVLTLTMLCTGLIYQATQPALPKLFAERLGDGGGVGVGDAALAVTMVYLVGGLSQVVWGHLADRIAARTLYILAAVAQVPLLAAMAWGGGPLLVAAAGAAVVAGMAGIPAESLLLARYTPAKWRGTAFGMKFVLSFGVSGLGVPLVSLIRAETGGFAWLFVLLAAVAAVVALASLRLPAGEKMAAAPGGAAAE